MPYPNPRLRAAILELLPETWTTVREFAAKISDYAWQSVRNELAALAQEGLIWKFIDATDPCRWTCFYCKPHDTSHLVIHREAPLAYTC